MAPGCRHKAAVGRPLILLALALGPRPIPQASEGPKDARALPSGVVESTEVHLMLLDVKATDAHGEPMRGLGRRDFIVEVDGREHPVYSVDDFCPCAPREVSTTTRRDRLATNPDVVPAAPANQEPAQFVLYLDFSHLAQDGRFRAVEAAKRWIAETMGPGDRAMLVAYADRPGLKTLSSLIADKDKLTAAADMAGEDPELLDPFSTVRPSEIAFCRRVCGGKPNCACWTDLAHREYVHSKRSLEALKWFLARLGETPGRKSLVYFNQDATMFPARYYGANEGRVGDHVALVEQIGAEANLSRTSIYTAYSGGGQNPLARSLGANLADFTGGDYNRGPASLDRFARGVGRGCECIYRIGLVPPDDASGRIHRVSVTARGRTLPNRYRVQFLNSADRWTRAARAALAMPETAKDIPLAAAIVPVTLGSEGWDARVQVVLDPSALTLLQAAPGSRESTGSWEVGALLSGEAAARAWEMVGVSELRRAVSEGRGMPAVVHERAVDGLRPGAYELRAFVRDRATNLYGSATFRVDLPRAGQTAMIGPRVLGSDRDLVRTTLPLRQEATLRESSASRAVEEGSVPLGDRPVQPGEPLEFLTWICPWKAPEDAAGEVRRFVAREESIVVVFDAPAIGPAGNCARLGDALDTTGLAPGRYTYHLRRTSGPDREPREVVASFEIATPPSPAPAATTAGSGP